MFSGDDPFPHRAHCWTWQQGKRSSGEVVAALLKCTNPYLIFCVPCWMAREAWPAGRRVVELEGPGGWASRAEQYSRTLGGQEGWTSRTETSTNVLGKNMISKLLTIPQKSAWSSNWVLVPPSPSHKPEGIGLAASLGAL